MVPSPAHRPLSGALGLFALAFAGVLFGGVPKAAAEDAPPARSAGSTATQRLVFALYHYSYQGDPRKPVPTRDIRNSKGLCVLTDHPWESVGPWMSYDRAQWHKSQFQLMAGGGIDVALAVYRGDAGSRHSYAIKGLDVMTQALKELRAEGQLPLARPREYPQIGMALDLGGLAEQFGGSVDLKQPEAQRSLYGMVRDFYLHVPEEFRATVVLPPSAPTAQLPVGVSSTPRGAAYVVRLIGDGAVKDADDVFIQYASKRFAQEFGARLLWVGTRALKQKAGDLDAVAPYPAAGRSAQVNTDGWIHTGSFGPGCDESGQVSGGLIRARENGKLTVADFRKIIEAAPDWIFIDSWNDYRHGSDIAPTLEYGLMYRDLIRGGILQYKQSADWAADFLKASAPRMIDPGRIYQLDVIVQNSGTSDWDAFNLVSLSYRWLKDGKPVGDPFASSISSNGQIRGESKTYLIGIAAPIKDGKPLPAGEYELEFSMTRREGAETVWFERDESAPLRIPITVGPAPAARPYWVNSTLTTLAKSGAAYPAQIRVRNDGSEVWKKGAYSVGYRWRKVGTYLKGAGSDLDTVVAEGRRVPLDRDVEPGRLVSLDVPVSMADAAGKPLPLWSPKDDWVYVLEWDVYDGRKYLSQAGGATYREPVEVLDRDPAPHFIGCSLPSELVAGRNEKITVGVRNMGPETWKKGADKIVVHWYYMDGSEASWNDDELPLPDDVPPFSRLEVQVPDDGGKAIIPGESAPPKKKGKTEAAKYHAEVITRDAILRDVPVRVPYYFGPMYCVLDLQHDGVNSSTAAATKGTDILVIPVNVYSPTFTPLPVSAYYNVDGISEDSVRTDGSIDGRGNTLPAEFLPPYVNRPPVGISAEPAPSPLYPAGLWVRPLNDFENTRVCFLYPTKASGLPNMIACSGQRLVFGGLSRTAVHFLALSTDEDVAGEFLLRYSDGSVEKRKLTFTHWNDAPKHGEKAALILPHRHTVAGDDPASRCYLNQYTIPAEPLKLLVGVDLPRLPAVKIIAVTLESASLRQN